MSRDELAPSELVGWFVVEAGRRQAWPFVNLADPNSGREVRIYLDAAFAVEPGWPTLRQDDDVAILALSTLDGLTVSATDGTDGGLRLMFGDASLAVVGEVNELTVDSAWRIQSLG